MTSTFDFLMALYSIIIGIYATLWVSDKVLHRPVELAQDSVK